MSQLINMDEVAKSLNLGYGRNKLFKNLQEKGIISAKNIAYQKYIDQGYFEVVREKFKRGTFINYYFKTVVTESGLNFINKILGNKQDSQQDFEF